MQQQILVPEVGENIEEVEVAELPMSAGATVEVGDTLIVLETEKAALDITAEQAGTISEIKVAIGDKLKPGDLLMLLEVSEVSQEQRVEATVKPEPELRSKPAPQELAKAVAEVAAPAPLPQAPQSVAEKPTAPASSLTSVSPPESAAVHASPSVRRFARELGVDLRRVTGTGRKNRVTRDDVQLAVKSVMQNLAEGGPANLGSLPAVDFSQWGEVEELPLSRIRQLTARNLGRSWPLIPQVTQFDEADITGSEAFRKQLSSQAEELGAKVTMVAILLRAVASALRKFPDFNSSLHSSGESLIRKRYINIGVAVDTPAGLVVPVVKNADQKGLVQLAIDLQDLSGRARTRKLKPDEMQGGCFTISSLGGIGGTAFTPVVNWPEVAILGVSRAEMKPVYQDGEFVPRLMLPLSLSYDHRVIDGAAAVRFTRYLADLLQDMRRQLL